MTCFSCACGAESDLSRSWMSSPAACAPTSSQRQQRTRCPGLTSSTGGNSSLHLSTAQSQRGVNAQPEGRCPGRGAQPGMPRRARSPVMSGMEASSLRVYGWWPASNSSSRVPISTTLPAYMTAMRSARLATTARSCVM